MVNRLYLQYNYDSSNLSFSKEKKFSNLNFLPLYLLNGVAMTISLLLINPPFPLTN